MLGASLHASTSRASDLLEGRAKAVDGDTLRIAQQHIRLWGIDAPDASQICQIDGKPWPCGEAARRALAQYVSEHHVRCEFVTPVGVDDDPVARCHVGDDEVNRWLVQQGWALDEGHRAYAQVQTRAALERRGLWQSQFIEPWFWGVQPAAPGGSEPATSPPIEVLNY